MTRRFNTFFSVQSSSIHLSFGFLTKFVADDHEEASVVVAAVAAAAAGLKRTKKTQEEESGEEYFLKHQPWVEVFRIPTRREGKNRKNRGNRGRGSGEVEEEKDEEEVHTSGGLFVWITL
jgi:hypothetical protein